ncbi:MAG: adenylate/guanylate cyclase domain-containing protein [Candidatus Riflebacteria bacterium]|nr:adenylate/guanylate cyclase domain-containing protein [Candidatus Riflebacteria bacterium]
MSHKKRTLISEKVSISAAGLFLTWLLMVVIPVAISFMALHYFLDEYASYSETGKLADAYNQLELYRSATVVENFLTARTAVISDMSADKFTRNGLVGLKSHIDNAIGGESILCVFFDRDCRNVMAIPGNSAEMPGVVLPPASLMKRQIQFLYQQMHGSDQKNQQNRTLTSEAQRQALSMQRLFKTITPVTLRTDRAVKSFSAHYGGELYFLYVEFRHRSSGPDGCLIILRGQDFSTDFMLKTLQRRFPLCRVASREIDVGRSERQPEIMHSGVLRLIDRLLITSPADQRFVRHVIHGGGIVLRENESRAVPFLQYHLPLTSMQHHFTAARRGFAVIAAILVCLSGLYCLRSTLFGIELTGSFKRRIMATTALAALFPFTFFATGFYLHLQYDEFLGKINLLQHVNARLAIFNNDLDQYFADIEGVLAMDLQQINKNNYFDDEQVQKIFAGIGGRVPISRIFLQRPDGPVVTEFADKMSRYDENDLSTAIETFFPRRTLQLLQETGVVDRTRQDILSIPGNNIKVALIGTSMISNGSFYNLNLSDYPVWLSNFKITDKDADGRRTVLGLVFARLEPAPLLSDFLAKSEFAALSYREEYGNYRIEYAFFPIERTGMQQIWHGSGFTANEIMQQAAARNRTETVPTTSDSGDESFVISRLNQGIPHIAVALARPRGIVTNLRTSLMIGLGSLLYLFLLLFIAGKMLDLFFVAPVIELADCAEKIARGGDSWSLKLSTGDELEELNESFVGMVKGLQQRNMLKDYVSQDAYSDLAATDGQNLAPGGEYRECTVFFAAIKDAGNVADESSPQQVVEFLNRFTTIGDRIARENNGSIDKIINQTLMLVFRENAGDETMHALRAARAALELASAVKAAGYAGVYAGIASGTVISGRIGSYQGKLDFTVIGNPVNLAARLKNEAAESTTGIIISGSTMRLLKGAGRVNFLRRCSLKGKAREYNIYELIDLRDQPG